MDCFEARSIDEPPARGQGRRSAGSPRVRPPVCDVAASRQAYQDFLALWSEADPDVPLLNQAREEYARLR